MEYVIPFLGLIGVIIGAVITWLFNYFLENRRFHFRLSEKYFDIRVEAYKKLLNFLSEFQLEIRHDFMEGGVKIGSPLKKIDDFEEKVAEFIQLERKYGLFLDNKTRKKINLFHNFYLSDFEAFKKTGQKIRPKVNVSEYTKRIDDISKAIKGFFEHDI